MNLSDIALLRGEPERAAALAQGATSSFRELGDRAMVSKALSNVAIAEVERGELERGQSAFAEGLRLSIEMDDSESLIWHLEGIAAVAALRGDLERAATTAGLSGAVRAETGFAPQPSQDLVLQHVRRVVDPETLSAARERAGALTHEEIVAQALELL
jgi:hypothetical protein